MSPYKRKAAETVRPRIFAFVVLLGAVASVLGASAAPQALAAPSIKLEVNQNCVDPNWPCWTTETSVARPQPALKVMIAEGGEVEFVEHNPTLNFKASVNWIGTAPACTGVPTTASMDWAGTCTFGHSGTYMFESSTMFNDSNTLYGDANYTKYEVVVTRLPGTPKAETTPTTAEHQTEATLTGSIEPEGNATEYEFEWGVAPSVSEHKTTLTSLGATDFAPHSVSARLTGLLPNTTYHFELIATYGAGKTPVPGTVEQSFTTPPAAEPTVSTLAASNPEETGATLEGTVSPEGLVTTYFFKYGLSTSNEHTTPVKQTGPEGVNQAVSATVAALLPDTEYHFRLVAENASDTAGPVEGAERTFKTASPPPPSPPPPSPPAPLSPPAASLTPPSIPPATIAPKLATPEGGSPLGSPTAKLAASQHGASVRGTVQISQAGVGGRLEVELLTKGAAAAVGKFLRSSLHAGKLTFVLTLSAKAKHTLKAHHKLALKVQIVLTPVHGSAVTITRSVVLHA